MGQITAPKYAQAVVLVCSQGAGIMTSNTHGNVVERRCSTTARGQMRILPGKPIYVHINNLTAKQIILPRFMIGADASSALTCMKHAKDDEPYISGDKGQISTQNNKLNSDPRINIIG